MSADAVSATVDAVSPATPRWASVRAALRSPWTGPVAVVVGSVLLAIAGLLPVWGTRLLAPQYPKGLSLWVYGGKVEGDVFEINTLNHYIGMQPIDVSQVPELGLWPLVIMMAGALLVVAVFVRGWVGRLALLALWLVPVGVIVDIQRWLVTYGTVLDPGASLQLKPFVPLAIGPSSVWNFTVWTYPGPALLLIVVVALMATIARRSPQAPPRTRLAVGAASLLGLALMTALVIVPAVQPAEPAGTDAGLRAPPPGPIDLQAVLDEAPAGTTVVVPAGTYRGPFTVARPLTMVADGDVLLDGGGRGSILTIEAPDVTVQGFRFANTGSQIEEAAAIKVLGDGATIERNHLERFFTGIAVNGADRVRILDNHIMGSGQVTTGAGHATGGSEGLESAVAGTASDPASGAGDAAGAGSSSASGGSHAGHGRGDGPSGQGEGISLWTTTGTLVRGNHIADVRDAVYLNFAEDALVDTNTVERSRYAIHAMFGADHVYFGNSIDDNLSGLVLMNTAGVLAGRNTITDNRSGGTGFGIVLKDVAGLRLAENVVARNRIGLQAEGTRRTDELQALVEHNRFSANTTGLALMATADLVFAGNTFDGNLAQVVALEPGVERHNAWIDRGFGNRWSDYGGFDLAADDHGDIPYRNGGAADQLLRVAPALEVFRTSPAARILEASQGIWSAGREPVVEDLLPLTVDVAPPPPLPTAIPDLPVAWLGLATGLLAVAALAFAILVRPDVPRQRPRTARGR